MKKYLLIIFSISIVFGQDTDIERLRYNYNTIYLQKGFFIGQKYVKGGESFPLNSIRKEMDQYQESSDLYDKSFMMRMLGSGVVY